MRTVKTCLFTLLGLPFLAALILALMLVLMPGVQGDDGPRMVDLAHDGDEIQRTLSMSFQLNGTDPADPESDLTPVLEYQLPASGGWPLWSNTTTTSVLGTAISTDGTYLLAGASDGKLHLFQRDDPAPEWVAQLGGSVYGVAISGDGEYGVAGSADKNVYLFLKGSNTPEWNHTAAAAIYSVSISRNGTYLAAGSADGMVYLFHRANSEPQWQYDAGAAVNTVALSADGGYLAAGTSGNQVILFQRDSSTPLWNHTTGGKVFSAAISDDGAAIAAGSNDNQVYLFSRESSTPRWSHATGGGVSSVSLSASGEVVAAGSYDNHLYLYQSASATPLWSYDTGSQVKSVALSALGDYLAAGTSGNQALLFPWDNATPLGVLDSQGIVWTVALSADGRYLVAGSDDPAVTLSRTSWESGYVTGMEYRTDHWQANFTPDDQAPFGNYTFRARMVNTTGGQSRALHALLAVEVVNRVPTALIESVSPAPAGEGELVTLTGSGVDDGAIIAYSWRSSLEGVIASSANFSTAELMVGEHTLYFSVQDDQGRWSPETTTILQIDNSLPNATIISVTPGAVLQGEPVIFNGTGVDARGAIIAFSWRSSLDGLLSDQARFTTSGLSVGNHTLYFAVQDDENAWSEEVNVTLLVNNTPPVAYIDSITPSPVIFGFAVTLVGHGYDPFENLSAYRWRSSLDGIFGTEANLTYSALSAGNHTLYFAVRDNSSQWSKEASAYLVVNRYPTAWIGSITPSPANQNDTITFIGNGSDPEGLIADYLWQSSLDGVFGRLQSFTNASLTPGDHLISLKVQDEHGLWSSPAITTLHVNARPTATILFISPALVGLGEDVVFKGQGLDPGGTIVSCRWESSRDGYLGNLLELTLSNLSAGSHNITLRVQDDGGAWSDPVAGELFVNLGPEILGVKVPARVEENRPATFTVQVTQDDGEITHYTWDIDGDGNYDVTLTANETTTTFPFLGEHSLRVKVRDDRGAWSEPFIFNVTVVPALPVEPEPEPEPQEDEEGGFLPGPGLMMGLGGVALALALAQVFQIPWSRSTGPDFDPCRRPKGPT